MQAFIWAITIAAALGIIGLVLIQHGKGADVGAAFGSGSAGSLFGASGAANFLSRTTSALAAVFFIGCLLLTYLSVSSNRGKGVLDRVQLPPASTTTTSPQPALDAKPAPAAAKETTPAAGSTAAPSGTSESKSQEIPK